MPFGFDDALMAAPAIVSIIQQMSQQGRQGRAQDDAMSIQMQNLALQQKLADRQYELATASRTNARGDKTVYVPGQGWVVQNAPDTASRIATDNALNRAEGVRQFTQGEPTRDRNLRRQGEEARASDPLLAQFEMGFGLPTRAGVKGKQTVADATATTEAADQTRSAATGAALRQGSGTAPLGSNLDTLDRNAASGLRTSLAQSDLKGDQMFESMLKAAQGNKLDPYNMLATRASGDVPRLPESLTGPLDTGLANASAVGAMRGVPSGAGVNDASKGIAAQLMLGGNQPQVSYDALSGVLAKILGKRGGSSGPVFTDTSFGGRGSIGSYNGTEFG